MVWLWRQVPDGDLPLLQNRGAHRWRWRWAAGPAEWPHHRPACCPGCASRKRLISLRNPQTGTSIRVRVNARVLSGYPVRQCDALSALAQPHNVGRAIAAGGSASSTTVLRGARPLRTSALQARVRHPMVTGWSVSGFRSSSMTEMRSPQPHNHNASTGQCAV